MTAVEPWSACWKQGQENLVVADVAAQEDNVLLAVHDAPDLRCRRVPLPGSRPENGTPATQNDLIDHFLSPAPNEGTLLVPVIGAPGIGKSHLIRWLKAALPTDRNFVIRHIPREGTSLPRVVELLFEGVEGKEFDELREKLAEFRGDLDAIDPDGRLDEVATRLTLKMAELLQFNNVPWVRARDVEPEIREALSDANALPALLTDAAVRAKLVREGGAVHRIARDIVEGFKKDAEDDDEELGFRPEDLNLAGVRSQGPYARRAVVQLQLPGLAEKAVKILTDALNQATAELVPTGGTSLNNLLQQFRRLLAEQDKELVLLFEDIAIARGLQLDLIDALTTPGFRPGEPDLCVLRVALAVTKTYWEEAPETLSTRAYAWGSEMYDMDLPVEEASRRAPELVGRYLNAARIGKAELLERRSLDLVDGVENACVECPLRDPCHAAFGKTTQGHGLFPLTETAVRNLAGHAESNLRPRMILSEVVAPTLKQRDVVNRHVFPQQETWNEVVATAVNLGHINELSGAQQEALERSDISESDVDRARTLLRAWPRPGTSGEDILSALGVAVEVKEGTVPERPDSDALPVPEPEPSPVEPGVDPDIRKIEDWGGGAVTLGPQLSRQLRGDAWRIIQGGIRWSEIGRSQRMVLELLGIRGPEQQQASRAVRIENAATGGGLSQSNDQPLLVLEPTARNARMLTAIRRLTKGVATLDDVANVRTLTEQVEQEVGVRLKVGVSDRISVTSRLRFMTLASYPLATSAGLEAKPSWRQALSNLEGLPPAAESRTRSWKQLEKTAADEHSKSREVVEAVATRSQGGAGAATALDITLVHEAALVRDPDGLGKSAKNSPVAGEHKSLVEQAQLALKAEADAIRERLASVDSYVGEEETLDLEMIAEEIEAALSAAEKVHLLGPPDAVAVFRSLEIPDGKSASRAISSARSAVAVEATGFSGDALFRIGAVDVDTIASLQRYFECAAQIIEASTQQATDAIRQRVGPGPDSRGDNVREVASRLLESCQVPR